MLLLLLISALLGAAGAWLVARFGFHIGLFDDPNARSSHATPTPRGGGIGFVLVVLLAGLLFGLPLLLVFSSTAIALLSLLDDKMELSPKARLLSQFLCAGLALWGIAPVLDSATLTLLGAPVFLVFIVGTANFYNFMDGINGIAGITGCIAFGLLAVFGVQQGEVGSAMFAACLAAACLGFLPFNMPKAQIFMGDVGSVLLGFCFAVLVLHLPQDMTDLITMASFLLPFYVDELTTMAMRLKRKENLLKAHRSHFYQFLANEKSISHWRVSVAYGIIQLTIGLLALHIHPYGLIPSLTFFITAFTLLATTRYATQSALQT